MVLPTKNPLQFVVTFRLSHVAVPQVCSQSLMINVSMINQGRSLPPCTGSGSQRKSPAIWVGGSTVTDDVAM